MKLLQQLEHDMSAAMKARETLKLSVLRMAKTALVNRRIAKGRDLEEAEELQVLSTLVKQRRDAIEQFTKGGRTDLADKERAEIALLEAYRPKAISPADMERIVAATIAELGATAAKDIGRVMKAVMPKFSGQSVEGRAVNELVRRKLGGT